MMMTILQAVYKPKKLLHASTSVSKLQPDQPASKFSKKKLVSERLDRTC